MQFFQVILAGAFAAAALAQGQLAITKAPKNIQAGQTVTIEWTGGDSTQPVTILLREGPANNLNTIQTLTSSATGGSYQWTVPSTAASASDYAFQIVQGAQNNYWGPIALAGGSGTLSTSATASASSAASSAASVSASASSASASSASSVSASASSASSAASSSSASASSASSASASSSSASASSSSSSASSASASSSSSTSAAAVPSSTGNAALSLRASGALALGAAAAAAVACVA